MTRSLVFVLLCAGCGPDERVDRDKRDTPGGIFGATCTATTDCGCHDEEGEDTFCDRESTQLQCLASRCSITCARNSDCTALFGTGATCSGGNYCLR
jgi:hypothetical protein